MDKQGLAGRVKSASISDILAHQFRACRRRWLPLDTSPGNGRSTVITPYDSRLTDSSDKFRRALYLSWLAVLRKAYPPLYELRKLL